MSHRELCWHRSCSPSTLQISPSTPQAAIYKSSQMTLPKSSLLQFRMTDSEYRQWTQAIVEWCLWNHLLINVGKTKEPVVDFYRRRPTTRQLFQRQQNKRGGKQIWDTVKSKFFFYFTIMHYFV
ncbi:hypothetical protein AMECASPLE_011125 [Ameca splendens]|uniref:PH domain-containing protein n=1 Tax=Ameca splendens TaxID=208324 RepID=A0ABV0YC35_9TELE